MDAVTSDGLSVLPRTRKARAVLAILVLRAPQRIARATVASLLWSRSGSEQARGSLRQALLDLHDALLSGGVATLGSRRESLAIDPAGLATDLPPPGDPHVTRLLEDLRGLDPAFNAWVEARIAAHLRPPAAATPVRARPRLGVLGIRTADVATAARAWSGAEAGAGLADGLADGLVDGLADGLAREITAALARVRWLALPSLLDLPGDKRPPMAASRASGIDYLLDGTVQEAAGRVRVHLTLHDLHGNEVAWTHSADRPGGDRLDLQRALAAEAVARLDAALLLREGRRLAAAPPSSLSTDAAVLAAVPSTCALEPVAFAAAGLRLRAAVAAAPGHAGAHAWLAFWHALGIAQGWTGSTAQPGNAPTAAQTETLCLAERAVLLDPDDARVLTLAGHAGAAAGAPPDLALARHERALALDPSLTAAWLLAAHAHACLGRTETALASVARARRLSPDDPLAPLGDVAELLAVLLRDDDAGAAIVLGRRALALRPTLTTAALLLLAALGRGGAAADPTGERADLRRRLLTAEPRLTVGAALARLPLAQPRDRARLSGALSAAGLPP